MPTRSNGSATPAPNLAAGRARRGSSPAPTPTAPPATTGGTRRAAVGRGPDAQANNTANGAAPGAAGAPLTPPRPATGGKVGRAAADEMEKVLAALDLSYLGDPLEAEGLRDALRILKTGPGQPLLRISDGGAGVGSSAFTNGIAHLAAHLVNGGATAGAQLNADLQALVLRLRGRHDDSMSIRERAAWGGPMFLADVGDISYIYFFEISLADRQYFGKFLTCNQVSKYPSLLHYAREARSPLSEYQFSGQRPRGERPDTCHVG